MDTKHDYPQHARGKLTTTPLFLHPLPALIPNISSHYYASVPPYVTPPQVPLYSVILTDAVALV